MGLIPSLSDISAKFGVAIGSGSYGQVAAGAAAAKLTSEIQTDVLSYMNKAGKLLGPILGTAGTAAFVSGASPAADAAQAQFNVKYLGGYSTAQIGGIVAIGALVLYLVLRRK